MIIALFPLYLVAIVALLIAFTSLSDKRRRHQRVIDGLAHIERISLLLAHIPQHRGAANAYLNGDHSFKSKLDELQHAVAADLEHIKQGDITTPLPVACDARRQSIEQQWLAIQAHLTQLAPPECFEQHSRLISDVIYLIGDIADQFGLSSHPASAIASLSHTGLTLTPQMVEICGQARGLGTGAIAKGVINTPTRVKLSFLHKYLQEAQRQVTAITEQYNRDDNGNPLIDTDLLNRRAQYTSKLLATMEQQLLTGEKPTIEASDFFALSSNAVESNMALITKAIEVIRHQSRAGA